MFGPDTVAKRTRGKFVNKGLVINMTVVVHVLLIKNINV